MDNEGTRGNYFRLLELNMAILFMSSSGILGKLITLPADKIIFLRCIISGVILGAFLLARKSGLRISFLRDKWFFIGTGFLMAVHWCTYFYSIKISNVSVAMISLFTFPMITALLEPFFLKIKMDKFNLVTSLLGFTGVIIIVPKFSFENEVTLGAAIGVFSALLYSIRNIWNKKHIARYPGSLIMFYQMVFAAAFLLYVPFLNQSSVSMLNWKYLLLLSFLTTVLGHTMFVRSFRNFSPGFASIVAMVQPVYGIILAVIFSDEQVTSNILLGGGIIILTTVIQNTRQYTVSKA